MANDTATNFARARAIFAQLLKQVSPAEREKQLARHVDDLQAAIDRLLVAIDVAAGDGATVSQPPVSRRKRGRPRKTRTPVLPLAAVPAAPVVEHVHAHGADAPCARIHEVVKAADNATVPSAVRAVLTSERDGLTTRAVVEGVKILRPETEPAEVSSALHAMRRRGEVAREGFHKNFKYRLVSSLTGLGSGIVAPHAAANEGGSTH